MPTPTIGWKPPTWAASKPSFRDLCPVTCGTCNPHHSKACMTTTSHDDDDDDDGSSGGAVLSNSDSAEATSQKCEDYKHALVGPDGRERESGHDPSPALPRAGHAPLVCSSVSLSLLASSVPTSSKQRTHDATVALLWTHHVNRLLHSTGGGPGLQAQSAWYVLCLGASVDMHGSVTVVTLCGLPTRCRPSTQQWVAWFSTAAWVSPHKTNSFERLTHCLTHSAPPSGR